MGAVLKAKAMRFTYRMKHLLTASYGADSSSARLRYKHNPNNFIQC